jgi:adenine deaminase
VFFGAEQERREQAALVARGAAEPDLVVSGVTLFVASTGEFLEDHDIWIKAGLIACTGPSRAMPEPGGAQIIAGEGLTAVPGLIDGHTHVFTQLGVEEFVRRVLPTGVTTVVAETDELPRVTGLAGYRAVVEALRPQPLRFFFTVSPLPGLTEEEEIMAPSVEEVREILRDERCLGLGEIYWGNLLLENSQGRRLRELAALALKEGRLIEGHTAGARGLKLQAYTGFGPTSDHEPISEEEVLESLRQGYWVLVREGAVRRELEAVKGIFGRPLDLRRLALCTDGQDAAGFAEEGYLDWSLQRALAMGASPALAYRMVSLNVAEHFRLDHALGSLAPGRFADLVLIPSPGRYEPRLVLAAGRPLFEEGRVLAEPVPVAFPPEFSKTVRVAGVVIDLPPRHGRVRAMELVSRLVTKEAVLDLDDPATAADVCFAVAVDRVHGRGVFAGFIKGFGLREGACASTMCWDTTDLLAVGRDVESIETAMARLGELGGGAAFAVGSEVVAESPAPLCGICSLDAAEEVAGRLRSVEEALAARGVPWEKPVLTVSTLATASIPQLRLTHRGYVGLRDRVVLSVEV